MWELDEEVNFVRRQLCKAGDICNSKDDRRALILTQVMATAVTLVMMWIIIGTMMMRPMQMVQMCLNHHESHTPEVRFLMTFMTL